MHSPSISAMTALNIAWEPRRRREVDRRGRRAGTWPTWCRFIRAFAMRPALSCIALATMPTIASARMGTGPASRDRFSHVPAQSNASLRHGLIDRIPEPVIEAAARRRHPGWPQVKGRPARRADGRIGRFGWKAQTASLSEFVHAAAAVEMGLEVPGHAQAADPRVPPLKASGLDMDAAECDALVAYVRSLRRPSRSLARIRKMSGQSKRAKPCSRPSAARSVMFPNWAASKTSTATSCST